MCCSPSGVYKCPDTSADSKPRGVGAPGGHASTATHRLRASAARSGTSCCHAYAADKHLAPWAG